MSLHRSVKRATNNVKPKQTVMHNGEILIPIVLFLVVFGIVYVVISARNRERMAMIDKGVNPQDFMVPSRNNPYGILKWGLLLVGVGLGLFLGSILEAYTRIPEEPAYFASALFFGGIGLAVAFVITRNAEEKK
jgi:hypothetical protein